MSAPHLSEAWGADSRGERLCDPFPPELPQRLCVCVMSPVVLQEGRKIPRQGSGEEAPLVGGVGGICAPFSENIKAQGLVFGVPRKTPSGPPASSTRATGPGHVPCWAAPTRQAGPVQNCCYPAPGGG